jgi:hypothetical protein
MNSTNFHQFTSGLNHHLQQTGSQQPILQLQPNDFSGPYVAINQVNGHALPTIMNMPLQTLNSSTNAPLLQSTKNNTSSHIQNNSNLKINAIPSGSSNASIQNKQGPSSSSSASSSTPSIQQYTNTNNNISKQLEIKYNDNNQNYAPKPSIVETNSNITISNTPQQRNFTATNSNQMNINNNNNNNSSIGLKRSSHYAQQLQQAKKQKVFLSSRDISSPKQNRTDNISNLYRYV